MLTLTNIAHAVVGGMEDSVRAYKRDWIFTLGLVTHKFGFLRFMGGVHKPVGEVCKPDRVLTINIIYAVDRILESVWENAWRVD
jgi:hypothetical protein